MSGKDKKAEDRQQQLATQQFQVSQDQINFARQRTGEMDRLMKPATDYFSGLASGNRDQMLQVAATPIANLTRGVQSAKENIFDSVPSGPARDFALAKVERDAPSQTAGFLNQSFLSSLDQLMQIGSGQGSYALQELGAGLRAGEASGQTNSQLQQAAAQRKASTMGFLGQIAGMAGSMATGGLSGGGGGGGSSFNIPGSSYLPGGNLSPGKPPGAMGWGS